jgi:hypothetical protein
MYIKTAAHEEAFLYMSGAVISEFFRAYGECIQCRHYICRQAPVKSLTHLRKYDAQSNLNYPSKDCSDYLRLVDNILHRHLSTHIHKHSTTNILMQCVKQEMTMDLRSCHEHTPHLQHFLAYKWIQKSIKIYCRNALQNLNNKRRERRKRKKLMSSVMPCKMRTLGHEKRM